MCHGLASVREKRTGFATATGMFERLLFAGVIAATSGIAVGCDISEAAPTLPVPARRDAGLADAGTSVDAQIVDAAIDASVDASVDAAIDAGVDASMPDAGGRRRRPRDAGVDAGVVDAGVIDADVADAAVIDAPEPDAAPADAAVVDAPTQLDAAIVDAPAWDARDVLRDASEAPPLYDARILM